MATKFLSLEEAAQQLGVSADELGEMRLRGEIFGVRDGSSWKFKSDEVERVISNRAGGSSILGGGSDLGLGSGVGSKVGGKSEPGDHEEVVLLSEAELGQSGPSTSSTVIGQSLPKGGKSQVKLTGHDSDSDLRLASISDVRLAESDVKLAPAESSGLPIDLGSSGADLRGTGSGLLAPESGLSLGEESDLKLAPSSDLGTSGIELGDEQADVLSGSGSGSDITHKPSDSGILLLDPADSGLSLDESPLGATADDAMGQTTDFDSGSLSEELKGDDDFLLTPLEEATDDESDSGSQVIMLDAEGEFDDATATLLASNIPGLQGGGLEAEAGFDGGGMLQPQSLANRGALRPDQISAAYIPELSFSTMSVVGLAGCVLVLAVCGMMMFDVVRNMWSWNQPYGFNSALMDIFVGK